MAKNKDKARLEKKNWDARFTLIGEAKITDYTYRIDAKAEKSDWVYNSLNLGVDCGENHGTVYAEMMGGYGAERDNVVYVHGIKEVDGKNRDDFENRFTVDWDDRFDESILESIGDMCFVTVGLEKDTKGNTVVKKFLSSYDAIQYINESLKDGMVVNAKGNIKYSLYQDRVQVRKEITSIFLSKVDSVDKYCAKFNQTMLLTKDSVGKPDKDRGVIPVYAKVLDYVKMYKDKEVKQIIPMDKMFEFEVDMSDKDRVTKIVNKLLRVRKGVTEITFEGGFVEGGALVTVTEDDIPDDIKELIDMGIYTLEDAIAKCSENTNKERKMIIYKPTIKLQGEDKTPVIQKFDEKYSEDDLILDFMLESDEEELEETEDDKAPFDLGDSDSGADDDWLSKL